jgi:predicted PurR-regulated permease PerM
LAHDTLDSTPTATATPLPQITIDELTLNPDLPTPIYITSRTRLILLAAMGLVLVWFALNAPSVPRLLLLGGTLALILSFPVRLLTRWMPRGIAIIVVVTSTIALIALALGLIIPFAVSEISQFAEGLPDTLEDLENVLRDVLVDFRRRGWIEQNPDTILDNIEETMFAQGQVLAETLLDNLIVTLTSTFNLLITAFGMIFIATYLLVDIPRFRSTFVRSFAPGYRPDADRLWQTLGESLSRYLAGLTISIAIQGLLVALGLYVIGVPYAVIFGLWMSATAILPYVGAFIGAIPAVLVALTISWQMAVVTVLLYVAVNQIDSNFITPRIQGNALRVHPLLIFLAVIAGGEISGAFGAILAVPTLAVLRVLGEFFWVRLRVRGPQQDTLLSAMRNDLAMERLVHQSATPNGKRRFIRRQPLRYHPAAKPRPVRVNHRTRRNRVNARTGQPVGHPVAEDL